VVMRQMELLRATYQRDRAALASIDHLFIAV
jgi:hypothetical protein